MAKVIKTRKKITFHVGIYTPKGVFDLMHRFSTWCTEYQCDVIKSHFQDQGFSVLTYNHNN